MLFLDCYFKTLRSYHWKGKISFIISLRSFKTFLVCILNWVSLWRVHPLTCPCLHCTLLSRLHDAPPPSPASFVPQILAFLLLCHKWFCTYVSMWPLSDVPSPTFWFYFLPILYNLFFVAFVVCFLILGRKLCGRERFLFCLFFSPMYSEQHHSISMNWMK